LVVLWFLLFSGEPCMANSSRPALKGGPFNRNGVLFDAQSMTYRAEHFQFKRKA
jgi:hypothetical protein